MEAATGSRLKAFRGAFLAGTAVFMAALLAGEALGGVTWPKKWKVFLPVEREAPPLHAETLASIPQSIEAGGKTVVGEWAKAQDVKELHGRRINLDSVLLDLAPLFGEVRAGNAAYVFLPLEADGPTQAVLGMGADWWMEAWLNGEKVLDTTETGNGTWPPTPADHAAEVQLRRGRNVLAVRFVSGSGSSVLAAAGPAHMAAIERLEAEAHTQPGDDQAFAMARRSVPLELPDADLAAGEVAGVQAMPARQFHYGEDERRGRRFVRDAEYPRFGKPVRLLLSKSKYPAEDGHLDAVAWLTPEDEGADPGGHLELALRDAAGRIVAEGRVEELHRAGVFFSLGLPPALAGGGASLRARWVEGGEVLGRTERAFVVLPPSDVERSGRIGLTVPNDPGARIANAPMTIGVPFPRGALRDERNVRLLDEAGREMPLQTRITARWSRYGPIKWLLCDFTADLDAGPRKLVLEFGPEVARAEAEPIRVQEGEAGFPQVEAGRLSASSEGVKYDFGDGEGFQHLLKGGALLGAFVRHEDGKEYLVPGAAKHEIEELGSQKAVVRRTGWYLEPESGERFCNYVTRMVFHRDSPVVRIYHTWIFTGDSNRDRIRNMGWRFPLAKEASADGFLASFEEGEWLQGGHLVQYDYDAFEVEGQGERPGGRAPGVMSAGLPGARVLFGAKDFWQNFPSELAFEDGGFVFHNWPKRNRPAWFERPVDPWEAYRLRFAHEGELLDFRLPEEFGMVDGEPGPIAQAAMRLQRHGSWHYDPGDLGTANAQGIARTEEMFLYFGDADASLDVAAATMQGLNDETLRPVVDPAWVAASGALGRFHHKDAENFPEEERIYEEVCLAPSRWAERLGCFGMWIHGDIAAWDPRLPERQSRPYRAYRKNHHGWPFRWTPYARSGDARMLKAAQAAARQMADANFCHYASAEVDEAVGEGYDRRQGWWIRSLLPWASGRRPALRGYAVECDYLWHSYYFTGCRRGKDVALLWGERVQHDTRPVVGFDRHTQSVFSAYIKMYQATFDPWFLVAFRSIGELHLASGGWTLHWRQTAQRDYLDFTGCEEFRRMFLEEMHPERVGFAHEQGTGWGGRAPGIAPRLEPIATGWQLTGEEYYRRRAAHEIDRAIMGVYEGETEYWRGWHTRSNRGAGAGSFAGWHIHQFPYALAAVAAGEGRPAPIPNTIAHGSPEPAERVLTGDGEEAFRVHHPEIFLQKEEGKAVPLYFWAWRAPEGKHEFAVEGPGGLKALAGTWVQRSRMETELPRELPAGVYRLQLEGTLSRQHRGHLLYMPVAHRDVPEVFVVESGEQGTRVGPAYTESQYWFRVPEGVERFWAEFPVQSGEVERISIWNPDMERAWDFHYFEPEYDGPRPVRAEVRVPPEHAGRLWRITHPGAHGGFLLDPQIPPVFSVSRDKWFDPGPRP